MAEQMRKEDLAKPQWCVCASFKDDHPNIGLVFDSRMHKEFNFPDRYFYYDIEDLYDFAIEGRIPSHSYSSGHSTYKIEGDTKKDFLNLKFAYFYNTNNDHHNELFFIDERGKGFTSETVCKKLLPSKDFRWGAGWRLGTEGFVLGDSNRDIRKITDKDALKKIKDYINNPEKLLLDINKAIEAKNAADLKKREERQEARAERLEDASITHALPTIDEVIVKNQKGRCLLMDKRFTSEYGMFQNLKFIKELGSPENIEGKTMEELYNYGHNNLKNWQSYIIEVSRAARVPFYKDGIMAWEDVFLSGDLKKESFDLLEEKIQEALATKGNNLFNHIEMNDYLENDPFNNKYDNIQKMKEDKDIIDINLIEKTAEVNFEDFIEMEETLKNWAETYTKTDEDTLFYKSKLEQRQCYVLETMGDTMIFMRDKDSNIIMNDELNKKCTKLADRLSGLKVPEIEEFISKNKILEDDVIFVLKNYGTYSENFKKYLNDQKQKSKLHNKKSSKKVETENNNPGNIQ